MKSSDRRHFMKGAIGAAGGLWSLRAQNLLGATKPVKKAASDVVTLGNTGIKLSRMAIGSGTNGVNRTSVQARLGIHGMADLLVHGFDQGVTFWETADQYGTHEHMREGMRQVGKNKVVLLTKTRATTAKGVQDDLDRFRRELGRDHLDIVLLHCMMSPTWTKECEGAMEALSRAREKGIIRAHGVSCHTLPALKLAAKTPWVQVDLARINAAQSHMDADPATVLGVLREMKQAGKGIIGMKIFGAGALTNKIDESLAFATKNDLLDTFTIGFANERQLDEVVRKMPVVSAA